MLELFSFIYSWGLIGAAAITIYVVGAWQLGALGAHHEGGSGTGTNGTDATGADQPGGVSAHHEGGSGTGTNGTDATGADQPEGNGPEATTANSQHLQIVRLNIIAMAGTMVLYVVLLCLADLYGLSRQIQEFSFMRLFARNYLLLFFWILYDTFVLDILVVLRWHPSFLRLPDRQTHGTISYHLRTIPNGMISAVPIALVATVVSWFVLL